MAKICTCPRRSRAAWPILPRLVAPSRSPGSWMPPVSTFCRARTSVTVEDGTASALARAPATPAASSDPLPLPRRGLLDRDWQKAARHPAHGAGGPGLGLGGTPRSSVRSFGRCCSSRRYFGWSCSSSPSSRWRATSWVHASRAMRSACNCWLRCSRCSLGCRSRGCGRFFAVPVAGILAGTGRGSVSQPLGRATSAATLRLVAPPALSADVDNGRAATSGGTFVQPVQPYLVVSSIVTGRVG
jgi:hypothetical protein